MLKALLVSMSILFLLAIFHPCIYAQLDTLSIHHSSHPDREAYFLDSLEIERWYQVTWDFYWAEKFDSIAIIACEIMNLAANWMERDTFASIWYHYGETDIGHALCKQGYFAEGLPLFREGIQAMADYQDDDDGAFYLSTNYIGIGRIYESFGYLEKALECYLEADRLQVQLYEKGRLHVSWIMAKAQYLGEIYYKLGHLQEAEKLFQRAYDLTAESDDICSKYFRGFRLLTFYLKIGAHHKAANLRHTLEASPDRELCSLKYDVLEFQFSMAMADGYFELDSLEKAESYYLRSLTQMDGSSQGNDFAKTQALTKCLQISISQNRPELARDYLDKAKSAWLSFNTVQNDFWNQLMLYEGEVNRLENDLSQALRLFDGILNKYLPKDWSSSNSDVIQWPVNPWIMQTLRSRVEVLVTQWEKDPATIEFNALLGEINRLQQYFESYLQSFSTDYAKGKMFRENKTVYDLPVRLLLQKYQQSNERQYLDQLFHFFEKSKALQLLSIVKDRQLQTAFGIPEDLLARERNIRKEITFYKKQLGDIFRGGIDSLDLKLHYQAVLNDLQTQYDSLQKKLKAEYPEYHKLKYDLSVVGLAEVQSRIPAEKGMITYYWGMEELFVLGITRTKNKVWSVPLNDQFINELDHFINAVARNPASVAQTEKSNSWLAAGWQLYRHLIEPFSGEEEDIQNWVFIPDGRLAYLPWSALPTDHRNFDASYRELSFLVKKFSLQQEYSASLFFMKPDYQKLLVNYVGVAPEYPGDGYLSNRELDNLQLQYAFGENFRQGYQPLLYNQTEIQKAVAHYTDGVQLLGHNASESEFRNYALKGRILHLAMHAYTNDVDPMLSHLAFTPEVDSSEDGLLYAYELYNMNIPADLAILSACNTGNGTLHDGQGVMSLARAFKYAGCQNVLMTLWPAHDRSTSNIISTFFDRLQERENKATALQNAMVDYLKNEPNEALLHPYYWSGFSLIGSDEQAEQKNWYWWWLLPVLLVILLLWKIWDYRSS